MLAYFLIGRDRSRSYSVHEPPKPASDRVDRAEALEFIREGFTPAAVAVPPMWLAARGIWMGVLAYTGAAVAILLVAYWLNLPSFAPVLALTALHLIFGAEADEMHRSHLEAKGWATVGHVTGTGALDCERRFFDHWLPSAPVTRALAEPVARAPSGTAASLSGAASIPTAPTPVATKAPAAGILGNLLAPLRRDK